MAKRKRLIPSPLAPGYGTFDPVPPGPAAARPALEPAPFASAPSSSAPIARVAGETAAEAALAEVSEAFARARAEGRLVLVLPLEQVDTGHLVRDRIAADEEEMAPLLASIRDHGQRTPVEVADLGEGAAGPRYGLISGWRRMQALARLRDETGEPRFGSVLALLRRPAEASEAYVAMVEENEIRQGLSYYERGRIAARAVDLGVFETERQALQRLFASASRARRSKIGSFLALYRALDGALRFPAAIPERLGLALAAALAAQPGAAAALAAALRDDPPADAAEEMARLTRFAAGRREGGARPERGAERVSDSGTSDPGASDPGRELRPGVRLVLSGPAARPAVTLSGPGVDADFRARLEAWLASDA